MLVSGVQSRPRIGTVNLQRSGVTLDGQEQSYEIAWGFRKRVQVLKLHDSKSTAGWGMTMQLRRGWQDVLCPELGQELREFELAEFKKYYQVRVWQFGRQYFESELIGGPVAQG